MNLSEFTRDVAENHFQSHYVTVVENHLEFTLACSGESLSTFTPYPLPLHDGVVGGLAPAQVTKQTDLANLPPYPK